jgi:hypothetical protein
MTEKQAGIISWLIAKYFNKDENKKPVPVPEKEKEEPSLEEQKEAAYVLGFMDKLAQANIQFLSDKERDAQKARLKNTGQDAGKGLRIADLKNMNKSTGVDKSIGIEYDYEKTAGILEMIGKYSVPFAERLKRWAERVKGVKEVGADTLEGIKGMDVGVDPAVDKIYRNLGKKTLYTGAAGTGAAVGINELLSGTELQDTEADA